jgi:hypothetical protein
VGGGDFFIDGFRYENTKQHTHYKYTIFHGMVYFPDPVEDIRNQ